MRFQGPEFHNDGGPLLVLPDRALISWAGTPDGTVSGDYGRACEVDDVVGQLSVEGTAGIVIGSGEGIMTAQWLAVEAGEVCLVGWLCGEEDSESVLVRAYAHLASSTWRPVAASLQVDRELVLLHAADSGSETTRRVLGERHPIGIGDAIPIHVDPGRYDVSWRSETLADAAEVVLCRWRRSA